jgi:hypothetical protein
MFGDEKREVVDKAVDGDPSLPLSSLLRQKLAPVELYWAP